MTTTGHRRPHMTQSAATGTSTALADPPPAVPAATLAPPIAPPAPLLPAPPIAPVGRRGPRRVIRHASPESAAELELRRKVGHLTLVQIPGTRLRERAAEFIRQCHPAGIALFGRNLAGPWATAALCAELQALAGDSGDAPLLIGMDQEGGQVAHLRYPCSEMPSNMARAAAGGPEAAGQAAEVLGREMVRLGINFAFAPVLDVNSDPRNPVIGARAFGDDPGSVAACGVEAIEGLRRARALSMGKHFPGHGDTWSDSHLSLPEVTHGWEHIRDVELVPFRAAIAAGVDSICSAHVRFPGIDPSGLPATLSPALMTTLLRDELGFQGALFADALVMDAIARRDSANIPPAAIEAIRAGVDCLMILGSMSLQRRVFDALLEAVHDGHISEERLEEAVQRVEALRRRVAPPDPGASWPDPTYQRTTRRLALDAVTLVRDDGRLLPLTTGDVGVVEFASGSASPVENGHNEPLGSSTLAFLLGLRRPEARFLALPAHVPGAADTLDGFVRGCDQVVVATRSACLDPAQAALLRRIATAGKPVIQLALRSPYDAAIAPEIGTVLLTYGDQPNGVAAAVDVLLGSEPARGRLPVRLPTTACFPPA